MTYDVTMNGKTHKVTVAPATPAATCTHESPDVTS